VLDSAFGTAGAFADADQGEADTGLPDDRDQPGTVPCGVPVEAVEEVLGPVLDLPTVPSGSRWDWSFLVAGQVAGKRCRRVVRGSLNLCRYSGTLLGNCERGS
jgi:hypothetical protein